jgi:hypothetical protein
MAFENRMTTDRAFFCRTAPMLKLWYAREPSPAEMRMLRGAEAPPTVEQLREVEARPAVKLPRRVDVRLAVDDGQARIRRHLLAALGSAASIKTLMVGAGVAAAVTYAYVNVPRAGSLEHAQPQTVAAKPAASKDTLTQQRPPVRTASAATTATKRLHTAKHAPLPKSEAPAVVALLPGDSIVPPMPDASFTPPSRVGADGNGIVLRGTEIGALPRDLGTDIRYTIPIPELPVPATGDKTLPTGGPRSWPVVGWILRKFFGQ